MSISRDLARFALGLDLRDVPPDVVQSAILHFLDAIGVGLAASTVPLSTRWADGAAELGGPGPATVLGRESGLTPTAAAMVNGALVHSLEYDDTHIASVVHGGAVAAPTALAAAEEIGASGGDLIAGYLVAWEAMIRLGLSAPGAFQANGFQITAVGGAIGAALATARIRRMSPDQTLHAMGIAGSQASGLMAFLNNGSTAKALNPGWAAHTGIAASSLAKAGMTGPDDVIEGRFGVFDSIARDDQAAGRLLEHIQSLGAVWQMPEAAFKLYPCCHYIHPFLEAVQLAMDDGLTHDQIECIIAHVPAPEAPLICEPWERRQQPASGYDGKWGLAYCMAALLRTGKVDVATFEHDPDPEIVTTARKIEWQPMQGHVFPQQFQARIEIHTKLGGTQTRSIENASGAPDRPIEEHDVLTKFRTNAGRALPEGKVEILTDLLLGLDQADTILPVTTALRA